VPLGGIHEIHVGRRQVQSSRVGAKTDDRALVLRKVSLTAQRARDPLHKLIASFVLIGLRCDPIIEVEDLVVKPDEPLVTETQEGRTRGEELRVCLKAPRRPSGYWISSEKGSTITHHLSGLSFRWPYFSALSAQGVRCEPRPEASHSGTTSTAPPNLRLRPPPVCG